MSTEKIISASVIGQITRVKNEEILAKLLKEKIVQLNELITAAAERGETEIADYFVDHRVKREVIKALENLGYVCKEQKVGNTYYVSWRHLV
jgi:hypothetical protein